MSDMEIAVQLPEDGRQQVRILRLGAIIAGWPVAVPGAGPCLGPQIWPDVVNHAALPSPGAMPERPRRQRLMLEVTPEDSP